MYKVASIDIETLGLNPDTCSLIEFGCVLDDFETPLDQLPKFRKLIFPESWVFQGDPYAMVLNQGLLKILSDWESASVSAVELDKQGISVIPETQLDEIFSYFLQRHESQGITIVGKNFANFDLGFLKKEPINFGKHTKYHRRILDVGSLYYDPATDKNVPGLEECLKRAGIDKQVQHTSIDDALDVLKCLRYKLGYHWSNIAEKFVKFT